uniref:Uncharacterized protein n=1 Tax=Onchocerca volvulus TaxID=6282 RepID=A0A8R1TM04_ONCVO
MAVLIFIIFFLYGIATILLMAIVLLRRRQEKFYNQVFVLIALQLIISHFLGFIPFLVVVIPEILQTKHSSYERRSLSLKIMVTRSYSVIILHLIFPSVCQEKNTTNIFDIRDEHHKTMKYTAVLLFIIFLLYGITTNLLMAIVLFCRRQDNYSQAFVLIALQLIISHFMAFLPQLVVVIPEILQTKNSSYGKLFRLHPVDISLWFHSLSSLIINNTFSTFTTFSIYALLHFSFLLALNRFVVFILPKYNAFFKSARLYFLIILVWLSVFGMIY